MREVDNRLAKELGANSNKYYSLNEVSLNVDFAKKSKYHGTKMTDGYIYNPYMHRRWISSMYTRMWRSLPHRTIEQKINDMGYKYLLECTEKEIWKLSFLQAYDPVAYEERKHFFTLDICKKIVKYHIDLLIKYTENADAYFDGSSNIIYPTGVVKLPLIYAESEMDLDGREFYTIRPLIKEMKDMYGKAASADSYYELSKCLKGWFNIIPVKKIYVLDCLIEAYHKAGAYYTLKNKFMNDLALEGMSSYESCGHIKEKLKEGWKADQFDEMLEKFM